MEIQTSSQLGLLLALCEINDTSNDKLFDHTFFIRHRVFFVGGDKPEINTSNNNKNHTINVEILHPQYQKWHKINLITILWLFQVSHLD